MKKDLSPIYSDANGAVALEILHRVRWDDIAEEFHLAGETAQAEFLNSWAVHALKYRLLGIGGWELTLRLVKEDYGPGSVAALKELLEELLEGLENNE